MPPDIVVSDEPAVLWPPTHAYATFSVNDFVTSVRDHITEVDLADVYITTVTSDEVENGLGDGNTTGDVVIDDCRTVRVRAERQSEGSGRVYTIHVAAEDAAGNVGTASFEVHVPVSKNAAVVDDGPAYTVASGCSAPEAPLMAKSTEAEVAAAAFAAAAVVQEMPSEYALGQNYPNPFNPTTTIDVALPEAGHVTLRVYDVQGREVAGLLDGVMGAGMHRVAFDASALPSGVYLYRIDVARFTKSRYMVLMK